MTKISDNPLNDNASVTSGDTAIVKSSGNQQPTRQARTLQRLHHESGSWSKLAAELDLNRGLLWKVAYGQIRNSPKVRKALRRRTWQRLVGWLRRNNV